MKECSGVFQILDEIPQFSLLKKAVKVRETNGNVLTHAREDFCCAKQVMMKIKSIPVD